MSLVLVDSLRDALQLQGLFVPDDVLQDCIDTAESIILPMLKTDYVFDSAIGQAVTFVAMDVYQSRSAANGNAVTLDGFQVPYKLGPSLTGRVSALLSRQINLGSVLN